MSDRDDPFYFLDPRRDAISIGPLGGELMRNDRPKLPAAAKRVEQITGSRRVHLGNLDFSIDPGADRMAIMVSDDNEVFIRHLGLG